MSRRAGLYLRISRDREGREAGVERQEQDARDIAERAGLTVHDVYVDNDLGASSKSRKPRPEYRRLLADARAGVVQTIVAYSSSRLTRRPREHEDLIELAESHGVDFRYARSPSFDLNTSAGRRVARILAANDAGEAEDIAERVAREKQQAAQTGAFRGGRRMFGYEPDGLTIRESEATELRAAADAVIAGVSLNSITRGLQERGVMTSGGNPWAPVQLRRTLMSPRVAGLSEHRGEVVAVGQWPAILPEPTWRALLAVLRDPGRRTTPGPERKWLGSGLYVCSHCGEAVVVGRSPAVRGSRYWVYKCRSGRITRRQDRVDEVVERAAVALLARSDAVELLVQRPGVDVAALQAERAGIREQLDELGRLFARKVLDARQVAAATTELRERRDEIDTLLAEAGMGDVLAGLAGNPDAERVWREEITNLGRRRAIVDTLMTVTLLPAGKGRRPGGGYFEPESVRIDWRR